MASDLRAQLKLPSLNQNITTEKETATASTFVNTDQTLTVPPGKWLLTMHATSRIITGSSFSAGDVAGGVFLTDTSGNIVSTFIINQRFAGANEVYNYTAQCQGVVDISTSTSYMIRIICSLTHNSTGARNVIMANGTGSVFSGADVSLIRAIKLGY